jgi:hypothetical protein
MDKLISFIALCFCSGTHPIIFLQISLLIDQWLIFSCIVYLGICFCYIYKLPSITLVYSYWPSIKRTSHLMSSWCPSDKDLTAADQARRICWDSGARVRHQTEERVCLEHLEEESLPLCCRLISAYKNKYLLKNMAGLWAAFNSPRKVCVCVCVYERERKRERDC